MSVAPGDVHEVQAATLTPEQIATAIAEYEDYFPGMTDYVEPERSGMHTTDTVDMELVVEGEIWLELDDGQLVHLRAGDTLVQNGTRHSWRNLGTETARVAAFMCGAHHVNIPRA